MNTLKEQNGKYYQEAQVVMIANNYAKLTLYKASNQLTIAKENHYGIQESMIPQHLYITSNEEIKEGDWVLLKEDNSIKQIEKFVWIGGNDKDVFKLKGGGVCTIDTCKKIIATTDESLGLPKPSDSFISKYIEEYNKGNQITDILVECEKLTYHQWMKIEKAYRHQVKVDSDNTITIKKVKDSYSREEVEKLLYAAFIKGFSEGNMTIENSEIPEETFNNWIKENL